MITLKYNHFKFVNEYFHITFKLLTHKNNYVLCITNLWKLAFTLFRTCNGDIMLWYTIL